MVVSPCPVRKLRIFSSSATLEIVQGQPEKMIDHLGSEPHVDAVRGFGEQERAQAGEQTFQQGDHQQGNAKDLKGVQAALADHLVDDHLNEQGIHQGEQLHHQRRQQHLGEHAAVTADRGQEPVEVESLLGGGRCAIEQQHLDSIGIQLLRVLAAEGDPSLPR